MAHFTNLHHVGEVLVQLITENLDTPGSTTVQVGAPIEVATGPSEEVRITLLWVTPQPSHRNDPYESGSTGARVPPPITLSAFFLVTTYGTSSDDPVRAHEILGNVLQAFHTIPSTTLPLTSLPTVGEGRLTFTLVPTTAELTEHVYTPLQVKHRPWALYEVSPIQLPMRVPDAPPAAAVRPGGIHLGGPSAQSRPVLTSISPDRQGEGGIVRLDVDLKGRSLSQVSVDAQLVAVAELTVIDPDRTYLLELPPIATAGRVVDLRLRVGDTISDPPVQFSEPRSLATLATDAPTLDAPVPSGITATLVLSGRALSDTVELLIWPDGAVADPSDVRSLIPNSVTSTTVEITAAQWASIGIQPGRYRVAVRLSAGPIAPFIVLELTP